MKVACLENKAKNLDLSEVTTLLKNEFKYNMVVGAEYFVMGILVYKDSPCVYYLIDQDGRPNWIPYMLFEVTDNRLPNNWFVKIFSKHSNGEISYLTGFYELCNDKYFYDKLINRDEESLKVYFQRKNEAV